MTFYEITKRILDIVGSIVGIILFGPIMIVAAIHIKRVSPEGPIFADTPLRVGKGGKEFKMFKFRSMIPLAHERMLRGEFGMELKQRYIDSGYKLDPDPRLIKGAKFLRKTSIDELPQFFNIFLGQMSLVGPRAYYMHEMKEQVERYPETKPLMETLLTVKPGLTGLWQISGRSNLSFPERVALDASYAQKRSILYDLLIIIKTPYVVLTNKGAV